VIASAVELDSGGILRATRLRSAGLRHKRESALRRDVVITGDKTGLPEAGWSRNASAGTPGGWQRFPTFATAKERNLP
jgi:hypothetical protein